MVCLFKPLCTIGSSLWYLRNPTRFHGHATQDAGCEEEALFRKEGGVSLFHPSRAPGEGGVVREGYTNESLEDLQGALGSGAPVQLNSRLLALQDRQAAR